MFSKDAVYLMALSMLQGIGNVLARQLLSYCGSAEEVFKKPKGKLMKIPNIGEKLANIITQNADFKAAENELLRAEKEGAKIVFFTDNQYPKRLRQIPDAPFLYYWKGNANLDASKVVAVVGTRRSTDYGKSLTEELISYLANFQDILVVSGLAYGIDIQVHKLCLQKNIPTVGVLGSGIDIIYPSSHKSIAVQMIQNGGLLSENKLGTAPEAPRFPERNRIIAGLSDIVIVVEAAETGGALITAEAANEYNREVAAYPGDVRNEFSMGCNKLIQSNKAHLITKGADIEFIMSWDKSATPSNHSSSYNKTMPENLSDNERLIWEILKQGECQIDELCFKSKIPINTLASMLLTMELNGWIDALPGKKFKLSSK
ncbi:MAG: DNA-processing protein DprA [Flammeovirgaceae bacterium]